MSEQEEQSKGFKVTDRRSFTREGERIQRAEEEEENPETQTQRTRPGPETVERAREPQETRRPNATEARFLDLLSLLATQASMSLGAPHPVSGETHEDLETARLMISMIEVLKEKTRNNLSRDEEAALEEILYQLRMEFTVKAKVKG